MIEYLKGEIIDIQEKTLVILLNGIGYKVFIGEFENQLYTLGEEISLHTHLVVREDAIELFGFTSLIEKRIFLLLCTVNGIGPKIAINMLNSSTTSSIITAIINKNEKILTKLPQCGKKTASRIILELEDKIKDYQYIINDDNNLNVIESPATDKIEEALISLGYTKNEITKVLSMPDLFDDYPNFSLIIKKALSYLRKN